MQAPLHTRLTAVRLVSGFDCEAITHWLKDQPPPGESVTRGLLVNDAGVSDMPLAAALTGTAALALAGVTHIKVVNACACCTGAVVWRVELARLLRSGCDEVVIVSNHWGHLTKIEQNLRAAPFGDVITLLPSILVLPDQAALTQQAARIQAAIIDWQAQWVVTNRKSA